MGEVSVSVLCLSPRQSRSEEIVPGAPVGIIPRAGTGVHGPRPPAGHSGRRRLRPCVARRQAIGRRPGHPPSEEGVWPLKKKRGGGREGRDTPAKKPAATDPTRARAGGHHIIRWSAMHPPHIMASHPHTNLRARLGASAAYHKREPPRANTRINNSNDKRTARERTEPRPTGRVMEATTDRTRTADRTGKTQTTGGGGRGCELRAAAGCAPRGGSNGCGARSGCGGGLLRRNDVTT